MDANGTTCVCWSCGAEIPGWWSGDARPLYDIAADDAAYERWLDTPCAHCGKRPQEGEGGE